MVKIRKIVAMVLIFVLAGATLTFAVTESDLIKQQKQLEQEMQQKEQELKNKQNEESKALKELRTINSSLTTTEKKLKTTESKLSQTLQELNVLEAELETEEENLSANVGLLSARVNTMYAQGDVHFLEVLLASTSITDFLTRWDLMSRLAKMDMELIGQVKEEIKVTTEKKNEVLVKKETLLKLQDDQSKQREELSVASSRQNELYKDIASEKKAVEAALDDLEKESQKIAEELARLNPNTQHMGTGKYTWPTPGNTRITSPYGMRRHPITKTNSMHTGVDIAAPYGSTIVSVDNGQVAQVAWYGAYGRVVMVDHGRGIVSMYAHTSAALVNVGDVVKKGQTIAKIGTTGWSTGPHLHFEVRLNGQHQNPMNYIKK
ncbi:MAG: peptidoglycan DD-metalloendopeptidase family protein [Clostridia bacterium]|jgi:murein DD-endopeptidase MepM/ murein hydrolase activator NlpD|nr:peptidoglycan DD-metalloendopeptidase family protein [Clostridia bacterium]